MRLDDLACDVEPDADACRTDLAPTCMLHAKEPIEHTLAILVGHAASRIRDLETHGGAVASRANGDRAVRGCVLRRIRQQVREYRREPPLIAGYRDGNVGAECDFDRKIRGFACRVRSRPLRDYTRLAC